MDKKGGGFGTMLVFLIGIVCGVVLFSFFGDSSYTRESLVKDDEVEVLSADADFDDVVDKFDEVYGLLATDYYDVESLDLSVMKQGSVKAFVDSIGDPYTSYLDNDQNDDFVADLQGTQDFEGIGAVVVKKDDGVMIEQVLKSSPAAQAGLRPLDVIIRVDNQSVLDETLQESVMRIRGPEGSSVRLIVLRKSRDGSEAELLDVDVIRAALQQPSVLADVKQVDGYRLGEMTIALIGEQTDTLFVDAIKGLLAEDMDGMILDLRGNGGGFLDEAVRIASWFVPRGELVVRAEYPQFTDDVFRSQGPGRLASVPVVILVDELTASAGEIIALALREQIGASIVGTQTFGKGSIQTLHEFADTSGLKYTVGLWYSPDDTLIDKVGITPDVVVDFDEDLYVEEYRDSQYESAERVLLEMVRGDG